MRTVNFLILCSPLTFMFQWKCESILSAITQFFSHFTFLCSSHRYFASRMLKLKTVAFGKCSFFCCATKQWKSLLLDIHHIQSSPAFRTVLKPHLYKQYHNGWFKFCFPFILLLTNHLNITVHQHKICLSILSTLSHLDVYNCLVHLTSKTLRAEQSTSICT